MRRNHVKSKPESVALCTGLNSPRYSSQEANLMVSLGRDGEPPRGLPLAPAPAKRALQGLGHWQREYPARVAAIIDDFFETTPETDPKLLAYAKSAQGGCVL